MAFSTRYLLVFSLLCAAPLMAQDEPEEASDPSYELVEAVHSGTIRDVRRLLQDGADASAVSEGGMPVLCYAAMKGMGDVADALITAGANLELKDLSGATALMYAAQFGQNEVLAALIEAGADINATDNLGWTPLIRAAVGTNADATVALLAAGADRNAQDFFGRTVRQVAEGRDAADVIAALDGTTVEPGG